jgi:RNA polymerase sigma factor (sigma-70 family)
VSDREGERDEEAWRVALQTGDAYAAWDLFIERYRRLIFAAIRHYTREHDEVMDVFADVCEALRENELARIRRYWDRPTHRARFSSWLVTVVRNRTVDWLRQRHGRPRRNAGVELSPLQQQIFEHVFVHGRSHVEAYELIRSTVDPALSFREFAREVTATYRAVDSRRGVRVTRELAGAAPLSDADAWEPVGATPDDPAVTADSSLRLASALESLEPDERLAVELFVVHELPAADVARAVRWPNAKAVYNRVYRALAALRASLERQGIRRGDL